MVDKEVRLLVFASSEAVGSGIREALLTSQVSFSATTAKTCEDYRRRLEQGNYDAVLADYACKECGDETVVTLVRKFQPTAPLLYVSSDNGEELAVSAIKEGASDFVSTGRLERLAPAVRRALGESREVRSQRREHEAAGEESRLHAILSSLEELIILELDVKGRVLARWADAKLLRRLGLGESMAIGLPITRLMSEAEAQKRLEGIEEVFRTHQPVMQESRVDTPEGQEWIEVSMSPVMTARGDVSSVVAFIRDISSRKQAEEAMRNVQARLMSAREQERRRIARELHDSVGQQIGVMRLGIKRIQLVHKGAISEALAADLNRIAKQFDALMDEVRAISYGLYPPLLEALGLPACLRQIARDSQDEVNIELRSPEALEKVRFSDEVEIALFRIAQEAVNNSLRHSQATRIVLELDYADGQVVMRITDNGIGFDDTARADGLGLNVMKERARAIGGETMITSRPGETKIEVRVAAEARNKTKQGHVSAQ